MNGQNLKLQPYATATRTTQIYRFIGNRLVFVNSDKLYLSSSSDHACQTKGYEFASAKNSNGPVYITHTTYVYK